MLIFLPDSDYTSFYYIICIPLKTLQPDSLHEKTSLLIQLVKQLQRTTIIIIISNLIESENKYSFVDICINTTIKVILIDDYQVINCEKGYYPLIYVIVSRLGWGNPE